MVERGVEDAENLSAFVINDGLVLLVPKDRDRESGGASGVICRALQKGSRLTVPRS